MNAEHIERGLRGMSEWVGEAPGLWERAVERAGDVQVVPGRPWWARQRVRATAAVAAVLLVMVGVLSPGLGKARSSVVGTYSTPSLLPESPHDIDGYAWTPEIDLRAILQSSRGGGGGDERLSRLTAGGRAADERSLQAASQPEPERAVVRKATMEIRTDDVRAAALRAQQLLSEPKGEYVESADIDDSDKDHHRADLVLRVEATRLEAVLTQLRELGEVTTERIDGEDVTDQMVDLGARLENERRVEAELLELLETRKNDKLDEVLAVRRELNGVREQIERLAAQQDNLSRMVRLARVAVMFRTEVKEPEPQPEQGVWGRFVERMDAAWDDGLDALLGTIAGLVRVLVGGAFWFGLAAVLGAFAWRGYRRHHPRPLAE